MTHARACPLMRATGFWDPQPERFSNNPYHHTLGLNILVLQGIETRFDDGDPAFLGDSQTILSRERA